jgi:hypothetical protein
MGNCKSKEKKEPVDLLSISDPTFKSEYTPAFAVDAKRKRIEQLKSKQQQQLKKSGSGVVGSKVPSPKMKVHPRPDTGDDELDELWSKLDSIEDELEEERAAGDRVNEQLTRLEDEMFALKLLTDEVARESEYREVSQLRTPSAADNTASFD